MGTLTGTTGGKGTRAISKSYPTVDGLAGLTKKQTGHKESLEPEEKSLIPKKWRIK